MNINVKADLFKLLKNTQVEFKTYEALVVYVDSVVSQVRGEENAKFYEHVRVLTNSLNNAGWEDRHNEQIQYLWDISGEICEKYEDYLP